MPDLHDLEKRIDSLEKGKDSWIRFSMQYLLTPVLLLLITVLFNNQIENAKRDFQKVELEIKRIDTTQKFMTELFSGTPHRAFMAERLMSKVLDEKLAEEISDIVVKFYSVKIEESLSQKDMKKAADIKSAAEAVQSPGSKKFLESLVKKSFYVVVGSFKDKKNATNKFKEFRLKGYDTIDIFESKSLGVFRVALGSYSLDRAKEVRHNVIKKGDAGEDTWIISEEKIAQ
jgi:hypothetical protein